MQPAMMSKKTQKQSKPSVSFRLPQAELEIAQPSSLKEEGAVKAISTKPMDTVILFKGACNRNGIKFSNPSPSISLTPPVTPHKPFPKGITPSTHRSQSSLSGKRRTRPTKLTTFSLFQYLPLEIRRKIWRWAVKAIAGRTILIQPYTTSHPAFADVSHEARTVFLEEYSMLHSRQVGRMSDFSLSINYDKDLFYLNRRFVRNPKHSTVTPIIEANLVYRDWLKPVKQLALNLKDTRFLLQRAWGHSEHSRILLDQLWDMLGVQCPELRLLWLVDDEAVELGTQGDLVSSNVFQPNRSFEWNVRWAKFRMGLKAAKVRQIVRQDLVLKAMNADKVIPEELIV